MDAPTRKLGGLNSSRGIDSASPKLLHRMGMQSVTWGATVERLASRREVVRAID